MTDSPIRKDEYETLADFRYTLRQFLRFSENAAEEAGLTPQQHQAMLAMMGFPDGERMSIGELAERLQIRHHSAVGLVNRLVAQKLVTRQHSVNDRRQVYITLSEHGLTLLETLSAAHREELRRLGPQLRQLLEKINA